MRKFMLAALIVSFAVPSTLASAQTAPARTADSPKGQILTDAKGMTLYVFDRDTGGKSACAGPCASNWPPLTAAADAQPAGGYTIVARDDGGRQWAYKGQPLYTWKNDKKPGDVTGDGFNNNTWHIAKP
jgi:predicted lipoprotein with Yx(FWY)xxD motif